MTDSQQHSCPPAPTSISPEAQAFLNTPEPFGSAEPPEDLRDIAGWENFIARANALIADRIGGLLPPSFLSTRPPSTTRG